MISKLHIIVREVEALVELRDVSVLHFYLPPPRIYRYIYIVHNANHEVLAVRGGGFL